MKLVPHCNECEYSERHHTVYAYLYCIKMERQICADYSIKTSPQWCPLRIRHLVIEGTVSTRGRKEKLDEG